MIWWSPVQVRWSAKILWVYFLCWCSLTQNGEFEHSEMVELDVLRCWDDKLGMIKWWISCSVKLNVEQSSEFSALLNLLFDWAIHWNSLFCPMWYLHMLANTGVPRTAVWVCSIEFLGTTHISNKIKDSSLNNKYPITVHSPWSCIGLILWFCVLIAHNAL